MFSVIVYKYIWDGNDIDTAKAHALLAREMSVPFPPFIGLELSEETTNRLLWFCGPITEVKWDNSKGRFTCFVKAEYPFSSGGCDYSFSWLVDDDLQNGWTLLGKKQHDTVEPNSESLSPGLDPNAVWPFLDRR